MATKAQHAEDYLRFMELIRQLREETGLSQRELGARLGKPQSWVYNCESGNRRMDLTEFILWARACGMDPVDAFSRVLEQIHEKPQRVRKRRKPI